jgi:hypothetical protein
MAEVMAMKVVDIQTRTQVAMVTPENILSKVPVAADTMAEWAMKSRASRGEAESEAVVFRCCANVACGE